MTDDGSASKKSEKDSDNQSELQDLAQIAQFKHVLILFACALLVSMTFGAKAVFKYLASQEADQKAQAADLSIIRADSAKIAAHDQLLVKLKAIEHQSIILTVVGQTYKVPGSTITSWLNAKNALNISSVTINNSAVNKYLVGIVNQYTEPTADLASASSSINTPAKLPNYSGYSPSELTSTESTIDNNLIKAKGLNLNIAATPYLASGIVPADFSKLIEVNLSAKILYAYENGNLVKSFLVSAGKPSTPTPVGEFQIWEKLTSQTMTGPGYVQPDVPWINYFTHDGDAIHGVYWRPASVFGNVNTSHGCVGLELDPAVWIYDWAPIGTTVVTYT